MIDFKEKEVNVKFTGEQVQDDIYITRNDKNSRFIIFHAIEYDDTAIDCTDLTAKLYIKSDKGVSILSTVEEKSDKAIGKLVFDLSQAVADSQVLKAQLELSDLDSNIQSRTFYINVGDSLKYEQRALEKETVRLLLTDVNELKEEFKELKQQVKDNKCNCTGESGNVNIEEKLAFSVDGDGNLYVDYL